MNNMTSPINLWEPLPRISNFRRPDNVKFVSVFVCYYPCMPREYACLMCVCMYVCVCAETVPHPPPYKFVSEGLNTLKGTMCFILSLCKSCWNIW